MSSYQCLYCNVTFSSPTTLTRHISKKHSYYVESETSKITLEEEPGVWDDNDNLLTEEADDDLPTV